MVDKCLKWISCRKNYENGIDDGHTEKGELLELRNIIV
jgi:hypothetical protein